MRVRYEIQSLEASGNSAMLIPVKCWRLTVILTGNFDPPLLDGQPFKLALLSGFVGGLPLYNSTQFTVGGVIIDGRPVGIDQVLSVTLVPGGAGVIIPQIILIREFLDL